MPQQDFCEDTSKKLNLIFYRFFHYHKDQEILNIFSLKTFFLLCSVSLESGLSKIPSVTSALVQNSDVAGFNCFI